jgi:MFS family permease
MYFSWYPTYLKQGFEVSERAAGWLAGEVLGAGAIGSLCGGFLGDWLSRLTGNRGRSLRMAGAGGLFLASVFLIAAVRSQAPQAAAFFTALACFCANVQLAAWWAVVTDITGKHLGTLFGLLNATGLLGALASQTLLGRFADWRKDLGYLGRDQWDPAFYLYAALLLLASIAWLGIDALRNVEPELPAHLSTGIVQEPSQHVRGDA